METISPSLALCAGNSPVTGEFPYKGQWRGALIFSLICAWTNGWVNNREAGNLRRHRAHYDVTLMNRSKADCVENTAGPPLGPTQMESPILGTSTLCLTILVQPNNEEIPKAPHCWPFVRGIHRWLVDCPHKASAMCKACPCHYTIKDALVSIG